MNMKRIIIDLLVILMGFALFIIWYNKKENEADSVPTTLNSHLKVHLITKDKMDQFWYSVNQGAEDMAELLGITYQWDAPEKREDIDEQIQILNRAVDDGADVILLAATDPIKISSAVEDAKARGVRIIYVDSPANEEAIITLATDNINAGKTAGETMISELEAIGTRSGSIGIIGVNTVTTTTLNRETGFREAIEADGKFTVLNTEFANGDPVASQEASEALIANNPDLVGLFGTNEGSTVGVGNAIKNINPNIIGIGFDKSDAILNLVRDESLNAVIAQNPYTMGFLGMAEAAAALKGYDTGPTYINTGISILMKR
jgi:ribose transport system substrate-binding protein